MQKTVKENSTEKELILAELLSELNDEGFIQFGGTGACTQCSAPYHQR